MERELPVRIYPHSEIRNLQLYCGSHYNGERYCTALLMHKQESALNEKAKELAPKRAEVYSGA